MLVLVGGAGGMDAAQEREIREVLTEQVVPVVVRTGAVVVDGGTNAGVMRAMGNAGAGQGLPFRRSASSPVARWCCRGESSTPSEAGDADDDPGGRGGRDAAVRRIAASSLTRQVRLDDRDGLTAVLREALAPAP